MPDPRRKHGRNVSSKTERIRSCAAYFISLAGKPVGALVAVVGLFSPSAVITLSLTVAPTDDPTLLAHDYRDRRRRKCWSRLKQLHKLVDVLRVSELVQGAPSGAQIMLVKPAGQRLWP